MSGSAVNSFVSTYSPYAEAAGQALGISPSTILAQWGLESGWGTSSVAQNYGNLAGIMSGGQPVSYSSPAAFTQGYVNTIASDFPGAVGTGSNTGAFVNGLNNGTNGSYFGSQSSSSYLASLEGTQNSVASTGYGSGVTLPASTANEGYGSTGSYVAGNENPNTNAGFYSSAYPSHDVANPNYSTTSTQGLNSFLSGITGTNPAGVIIAPGTAVTTGITPGIGDAEAGEISVGLQPGAITAVTDAITSGYNAITGSASGFLQAAQNWFVRGFLIVIGLVILAFALWHALGKPDMSLPSPSRS